MIKYKKNIMDMLLKRGYSCKDLLHYGLSAQTQQNLRDNKAVSLKTINIICLLLRCDLSDVLSLDITDEEKIKYF